jgi:phage/plasmid-associated DNA primase
MNDLSNFLNEHKCVNGKTSTHTRIPDKTLGIYGGSFSIEGEDLCKFLELYYNHVFLKGNKEYLTEKQLESGGPMAVDFDFRYSHDIDTRQHTVKHIEDMILLYLEELKEVFLFEENKPFDIFIFEKPNVNRLEDGSLTKDGIHMIIGCKVEHKLQLIIRDKILTKLEKEWSDLPLINTWDSVLDEGISRGTTNWQLFGSRKPGHEAYELTRHYAISYDSSDGEFMINVKIVEDFDFKNKFIKLSVQYDSNPKFELNPKILNEYNKKIGGKNKNKTSETTKAIITETDDETDNETDDTKLQQLVNLIKIKQKDRVWLKICSHMKYNGMKETDWEYFCERNKLNWDTEKQNLWNKYDDKIGNNTDYLEELARQSNTKGYNAWVQIWNKPPENDITLNEDIEKILETCTEYDIATYFNKIYGKDFKCIDIAKKGTYYQFTKNKLWEMDEGGTPIREIISNEMYKVIADYLQVLETFKTNDDIKMDHNQKKKKVIGDLLIKLKRTADKNNILREIADIIKDTKFTEDLNKELFVLPIKNGKMINLKTLKVYERTIDNKFSYECDANYVEMTEEQEADIKKYFMELFCDNEATMKCVLNILKSIFTGQTLRYIYFFSGSGSNGKTLLFNILKSIFKNAMDTIATDVILKKKGNSSLNTEIEKTDKCRLGYVTELKEEDELNEKTIKQITGGDAIDFRGLFKGNVTITPTCNLCVLTNELPNFKVEKAICNRIINIPFNNVFKVDKSKETEMLGKRDLVFSYIMKHGILRDNFDDDISEEMKVSKANYVESNVDNLKDFIKSNLIDCENDKDYNKPIPISNFREKYDYYCKQHHLKIDISTKTKFTQKCKSFGLECKESHHVMKIYNKSWVEGEEDNDAL